MSWIDRIVKKTVDDAVESYFQSDDFKRRVIDLIMSLPDDQRLTKDGFLAKMAGHMHLASSRQLPWDRCKEMAWSTWCEFTKDNRVRFGDKGWDWTGAGAKTLAYEYSINYWD